MKIWSNPMLNLKGNITGCIYVYIYICEHNIHRDGRRRIASNKHLGPNFYDQNDSRMEERK